MRRFLPYPATGNRRKAMLTIAVMVCLVVLGALAAAWTRTLVLERRAIENRHQRLQAEYLARSGMERARTKAETGDYAGETWRVEANELDGRHGGTVQIDLRPSSTEPDTRLVKAVARFPAQT